MKIRKVMIFFAIQCMFLSVLWGHVASAEESVEVFIEQN